MSLKGEEGEIWGIMDVGCSGVVGLQWMWIVMGWGLQTNLEPNKLNIGLDSNLITLHSKLTQIQLQTSPNAFFSFF